PVALVVQPHLDGEVAAPGRLEPEIGRNPGPSRAVRIEVIFPAAFRIPPRDHDVGGRHGGLQRHLDVAAALAAGYDHHHRGQSLVVERVGKAITIDALVAAYDVAHTPVLPDRRHLNEPGERGAGGEAHIDHVHICRDLDLEEAARHRLDLALEHGLGTSTGQA